MRKFNKEHIADRDEVVQDLKEAKAAIELEYEEFKLAAEKLNGKVRAYNEALAEADTFREEIVSEMDGYMSDKSEKWADGDAGQEYSSWYNEWENLDLTEVEYLEMPDLFDLSHAEEIEQLPEQPG
jgi:uncharacterized protein YukE